MRYGFLSSCFEGVALKRLREVEVNPRKSNQHELNGSEPLKQLLALQAFNERPATFVWLGGENEGISEDAWVTWYDSRENQPHRAAEWRLYYPTNAVMELAQAGDLLLVVARRPGNQLMLIIAPDGTTANQLAWLFGIRDELEELGEDFRLQEIGKDREIDFVTGYILDDLGIEFEEPETARLDALIIEHYPDGFPSTRELLRFVRNRIVDSISAQDDPDAALLTWMNEEKALFRHIERREVSNRLEKRGLSDAICRRTNPTQMWKASFSIHCASRTAASRGRDTLWNITCQRSSTPENYATQETFKPRIGRIQISCFRAKANIWILLSRLSG